MRVTVRFVDGEQLVGNAERVSLDRGGFTLSGSGGNTRSVWVSAGAIKYVVMHPRGAAASDGDADPRGSSDLAKVVLHFLDGEILHSYQDEAFGEKPGGFQLRLWDADSRGLVKVLVSGSSLKGVFFVEQWDSGITDETHSLATPDEATMTWVDEAVIASRTASAQPEVEAAGLRGPMLVEEPALLTEPAQPEPLVRAEDPTSPGDPEPMLEPGAAVVIYDSEERRPGFRSALTPRRRVAASVPTREELRYRQLRARISEVLGQVEPQETAADTPDEPGED